MFFFPFITFSFILHFQILYLITWSLFDKTLDSLVKCFDLFDEENSFKIIKNYLILLSDEEMLCSFHLKALKLQPNSFISKIIQRQFKFNKQTFKNLHSKAKVKSSFYSFLFKKKNSQCSHYKSQSFLMGNCVNKDKGGQESIRNRPQGAPTNCEFGIEIIQSPRPTVKFHHSPLSNCQFLMEKFKQSVSRPQEVNLTFMIQKVEVNQKQNSVTIYFMNQNPCNIYLIIGGEEGVSKTGLTIDLTDVLYVEKVHRQTGTPKEGNKIVIVPTVKLEEKEFRVILEPILKVNQSMFLIQVYNYEEKDRRYKKRNASLQWSSLAFNLQQIYGSQNEFKVDSGEMCTVCLSSPSNVILTPCRHMCICKECSKSYEKSWNRCPICRKEFISFIQYS